MPGHVPARILKRVVIAAAFWIAAGCIAQAGIAGTVSVLDGHTIEIHGQRVRPHGIDVPESSQTCLDGAGRQWRCGQRAALALQELIGRRTVTCHKRDTDHCGRVVAQCHQDGIDTSEWLVSQALAYRRYSEAYIPA